MGAAASSLPPPVSLSTPIHEKDNVISDESDVVVVLSGEVDGKFDMCSGRASALFFFYLRRWCLLKCGGW
jgi:hypothetical protein